MYVNYMIVPVAAFEYSMARKLVNCKPSIPVSEKNRKEQILFPLFHTENNFLSFFRNTGISEIQEANKSYTVVGMCHSTLIFCGT